MSVAYANHWGAAKLLREMTEEQRDRVRQQIADQKLLSTVLGRGYNRDLCLFVEKRLNGKEKV